MESTMTTQLDAAFPVHTRLTSTAPEGVIPQPRSAELDLLAPASVPITRGVPAPRTPVAPTRSVEEVDALWEEYKAAPSARAREGLILHYAPLVSAVAGRVGMRLPSTAEQADLVSYGMFGLIDAIEKYQTDRSVKFESYASSRIRGAIIDELRAMDWVPRSVRTKARSVDRAYADLEAKLHRTPTEDEVAQHLEMPVEDLRAIYSQLSTVNVAALDELLGGGDDRPGGVSLGDTLGDERTLDPASSIEAAETKFLLARAIECLGERERIVVVLYYYEGMTLAEIGRVLGVTESRISQMHTAAMVRLRTRLLEAERA
jgi:RNA polymerase sigma factor for flagellar operon FliA